MSIDKIRNIGLDKLVTQVYDFDSLTTDELMCKFAQKINIIIEHFKYLDDRCYNSDKAMELKLQYLLDQGLGEQVAKEIINKINDGSLAKLINDDLLNDIKGQMSNKASVDTTNSLQSQIDSLVINASGDSNTEVVQARTNNSGSTFSTLKGNLDNIENLLINNEYFLSFGDWVAGTILTDGSETNDTKYLRTSNLHTFSKFTEITVTDGYKYRISKYSADGAYITSTGFINTKTIMNNDGFKYKFTIQKSDNTVLDIADYSNLKFKTEKIKKYNEKGASFIEIGKNLIDVKNIKLNTVLVANTGLEDTNSQYCTSDFIPLKNTEKLYVSPKRNYVVYNENKERIGANTDETTENSILQFGNNLYSGMAYVRISFRNSELPNIMASYDEFSSVGEYGLTIDKLRIKKKNLTEEIENFIDERININIPDTMVGKIIFNFGDSIAAGDGNNGKGYAELIGEKYGLTVYDYAVGGATLGDTESNNITAQVDNAITSEIIPDFILINGGTNDIVNNVDAGLINTYFSLASFDKTTTTGGLQYCIYKLKEAFPSAKIVFVSVHKMGSRDYTAQTERQNKCIEVCNKWGVPVADIGKKGNLNTFLPFMHKFTNSTESQPNGDRTHPNELGYLTFYVDLIFNVMKNN